MRAISEAVYAETDSFLTLVSQRTNWLEAIKRFCGGTQRSLVSPLGTFMAELAEINSKIDSLLTALES